MRDPPETIARKVTKGATRCANDVYSRYQHCSVSGLRLGSGVARPVTLGKA